nr:type I polyketide synthase 3 [Streptomyces sp.]
MSENHLPNDEEIAVVGLSCRLPMAGNPQEFWSLLRNGESAITQVPPGRWSTGTDFHSDTMPEADAPARWGGFLDQVDGFDARFFGISPGEAVSMDPQQRLMLELGWEALEDAGQIPADLRATSTGVFVGAIAGDYALLHDRHGRDASNHRTLTGLHRSLIANRLSYVLGAQGPSLTVDSGQSSSLVAVHLACDSLRAGESTLALAGGVNLNLVAEGALALSRLGVLSPDGRCHTFDSRANGFVRGEGGAMAVLKPLARALADNDRIYCLIRGSAVNNDGPSATLTTPSADAQSAVVSRACRRAGVDPRTVQYVELHGTGTKVGDPIEASALASVLGAARTDGEDPVLLGSAKTNVGHLEGAAGIVGFLKTALAIKAGEIPATLNFAEPNPRIPLEEWRLRMARTLTPWPTGEGGQRLAGVSSFGVGGTNCHLVLSSAPAPGAVEAVPEAPDHGVLPWVVSARSAAGVTAQARRLAEFATAREGLRPVDIGRSLTQTRSAFEYRAVVLGEDRQDLLTGLAALGRGEINGQSGGQIVTGRAGTGRTVFVFPGQGSQWAGMTEELRRTSPVFRSKLEACADALAPHTGWELLDVLRGTGAPGDDRGDVIQPVLFAVMVSLAEVWRSLGVVPDAVVGHSQGELAAAHVAGALSLEDAAKVTALRGKMVHSLNGTGRMATVPLPAEQVAEDLAAYGAQVYIAGINSPARTTVSGDSSAVEELTAAYQAREIRARIIESVAYASHCPLVEPAREELLELLSGISPRSSDIPFYSTLTGGRFDTAGLDADYWYRNLSQPVLFEEATRALSADGHTIFVESSPHPLLTLSVEETLEDAGIAIASLQRDQPARNRMLKSLAQAYAHGAPVDWTSYWADRGARHADLPTYAFQRERYWLDMTRTATDDIHLTDPPQAAAPEATAPPVASTPPALPDLVQSATASVLGYFSAEALEMDRTFKDLGLDSVTGAELSRRLSAITGLRLPTSLIFDCPTPEQVVAHLSGELGTSALPAPSSPFQNAPVEDADEPIAIVAMACRYPGEVETPEQLWEMIAAGGEGVSDFPVDREWDLDGLYHPDPEHAGTTYTRRGGFLHGATRFDADFFGISPREAASLDPQQRLLLEVAWETVERGGLDPRSLRGSQVGVFIGAMAQDYGPRMHETSEGTDGGFILTGTTSSVLSGRIAYSLGLEGPAVTVDTACSSSLVALHLASQALRSGECSMALAGGVTVMSSPGIFVEFSRQRGLSADGRCKAFAEGADGTGWGEGTGLVLLERLSDAERLGHRVLAVVRGSAVNQDGASNGLTAPNGPSQQRVIRQALANARLSPDQVDVVEAHGTGTTLGDPIEAQALLATYGQDRAGDRPLWLGSLKSNIGHTQAAAGVAGVIKMVMALRHGVVPRTLHVDEPSSHVDWSSGAVSLATEEREWPDTRRPRRAAVSSFGISGTNAHLILEQAPATEPTASAAPEKPDEAGDPAAWSGRSGRTTAWPVSGRNPQALAAQAGRLASWARTRSDAGTEDVALALATSRSAFEHRAVAVGPDTADLTGALEALAEGQGAPGIVTGVAPGNRAVKTVFVFPGQGAQWIGMAAGLLHDSPLFAAQLDACARALEPHTDWRLLDVLQSRPGAPGLDRVDVVQPALFAVMVGLAALWRAHGIHPDAVIGHSQGEVAAACVAGALTLPDAARIVTLRSKSLAKVAGTGGMASLPISADRARALIADRPGLHLAAVNGPAATVVAGDTDALARLIAHCQAEDIDAKAIAVDYASHTPHMTVLRDELLTVLAGLKPTVADVPFYSTVTGGPLETTALTGEYWYQNLTQPVLFHPTLDRLVNDGHRLFVETSPHPVLIPSVQHILYDADAVNGTEIGGGGAGAAVATLRRDAGGRPQFLTALATAYVNGAPVDWPRALARPDGLAHPAVVPADLPTYAFQHQRYWIGSASTPADVLGIGLHSTGHPLLAGTNLLPDGTWHATGVLSTSSHPWLADHAVHSTPLLPATAQLDLALAAGTATGCPALEELTLHAPLPLDDRPVHLHITVSPPDQDADGDAGRGERRRIEIHSRPQTTNPDRPWTHHATGTLTSTPPTSEAEPASGQWPPAEAVPVPREGVYPRLAERGYGYGPAFQNLRAIWRQDTVLYADVRLAPDTSTAGYGIHPALLDAALHTLLIPAHAEDGPDTVALPFSWSGVHLHATDADTLRVRLTPTGPHTVQLTATDPAGHLVVAVDALTLRPLAAHGLTPEQDTQRSTFRLDWHPLAADGAAQTAGIQSLTVLGDLGPGPLGALTEATDATVTHHDGLADLTASLQSGEPVPDAVLAVLPTPGGGADVAEQSATLTATVLRLLQDWLATPHYATSRLILTTTHAVSTSVVDPHPVNLAHASVWGLVRCAQAENSDQFLLLDTDHLDSSARALPVALAAAFATGDSQLAVRDGQFSVTRLTQATANGTLVPPASTATWQLEASGRSGTLDQVVLAASEERDTPLGPEEIRIAVRAAGLNFRDVMVSLGLVPVKVPIGGEDAGVVTEVGSEVTELAPGDRVMGMSSSGGIGPVRVTDHRLVTRIPEHWSFTDAVTVPAAFLTAYHALVDLARIQPGDKILIHTATGGVGMAAVQLARHLGAEIYATASAPKWDTLRAMGLDDDHIASSRTLDFEDHFREHAPDGLDIVLNSLANEAVDASLRLLSPHGRFIEMGKTDIRDARDVAAVHPDLLYRSFDLLDVGADRIREMFTALDALFGDGTLQPLPATTWPLSQARQALRHFSLARHTGKITLSLPPAMDPAGTVLITGGTGTLGGLVARHLVGRHGIRHLLLTSRSGPDAAGASELHAELTGLGAQVTVTACDAADPDALARLFNGIPDSRPLTAVIHAAGALDDGTVPNLTSRHIQTVFRPKAEAAWNLHRATEKLDLAAFVLFSSATATLGNPGQANYAAANSFLDGLGHHRRTRGLPATSLAWGLWEEASGMTSHLNTAQRGRVISHAGITPLATDHALALLDTAIRLDEPFLLLSPLALSADPASSPALLRALSGAPTRRVAATGTADESGITEELVALSPEDQHRHLLALVRSHAATVLGHPTLDTIAANHAFKEIGFDSLTAVELRNRLTAATRLRLSPTLVFDHPTPAALATHLHTRLSPHDADVSQRVLRDIEKLETVLSDVSLDESQSAAIKARLEGLLWKWDGSGSTPMDASEDDLSSATDDEIFGVIENELGLS